MRKAVFSLAVLALAGAMGPVMLVADATSARAQEATPLGTPDTTFLAEAIRDGLAEVEIAKAATQKASNAEVKQFAERMVKDHSAVNEKLMALAKKHKIEVEGTFGTPPLRPDETETAKLRRELLGLSGEKFDQAFVKDMVQDHEKAISRFKEEAKTGEDKELKDLVSATLPALEEHLQMARSLEGRVGMSR